MNNTTKISLSFELQGRTLVRQKNYEVHKSQLTVKDFNPEKKFKGEEGDRVVRYIKWKSYPVVAIPATQHINMSIDAYNYFISNECPSWAKAKNWYSMSKTQRLEMHLQRTVEHFGGTNYTYQILEDE